MQNARLERWLIASCRRHFFPQVAKKSPSMWCPSELMKRTLFISGILASLQALLIIATGTIEVYNSYRYTIIPVSDGDGFAGGPAALVAALYPFLRCPLFFSFLCLFIRERRFSFPANLFTDLFRSHGGGWYRVVLRCIRARSTP